MNNCEQELCQKDAHGAARVVVASTQSRGCCAVCSPAPRSDAGRAAARAPSRAACSGRGGRCTWRLQTSFQKAHTVPVKRLRGEPVHGGAGNGTFGQKHSRVKTCVAAWENRRQKIATKHVGRVRVQTRQQAARATVPRNRGDCKAARQHGMRRLRRDEEDSILLRHAWRVPLQSLLRPAPAARRTCHQRQVPRAGRMEARGDRAAACHW